jgi:hypothetical protein
LVTVSARWNRSGGRGDVRNCARQAICLLRIVAVATATRAIRNLPQLKKRAIDFIVPPPVLFSEVCAIMEDDDTLRADAPLCPTCKNPMELGRVRIEGYPYVPSFECWPCLEVFTEANEPR